MFATRAQAIRQFKWQTDDYMAQLNRIMPLTDFYSPDFDLACELMSLIADNQGHEDLLRNGKARTASQCLRK